MHIKIIAWFFFDKRGLYNDLLVEYKSQAEQVRCQLVHEVYRQTES